MATAIWVVAARQFVSQWREWGVSYDRVDDRTTVNVDVVGLYSPDLAAVVAAATASDPGSGPVAMDD